MRAVGDAITLALAALRARKGRAVLMAVGPLLGVAAVVGALGLSSSAKAAVRDELARLGTELVVVEAGEPFGGGTAALPAEAPARVRALPGTVEVAGLTPLNQVPVARAAGIGDPLEARVLTAYMADATLPAVVDSGLSSGRFLGPQDERSGAPVAVLGARAAATLGVLPGEPRTVLVGGQPFGVIGVLAPVPLLSTLDDAVLLTPSAASRFSGDTRPARLLVRTRPGSTAAVAAQMDLAVTYGDGPPPTVRVPSDLLAARATVDQTLQLVVLAMGALAMLIGGLGIANVMTISVLQRATEIGVRRALGHRRSAVAGQFLVEACAVGLAGGLAGLAAGAAFVALAAIKQGWVFALDYPLIVGGPGLAVAVAVVAGCWPASRAARLHPAACLRSG